jgi:uncharacterized protein (TIGR00369 family)
MDYDAIRDGLSVAIPFNQHLGLEFVEVGPGTGKVRLPARNEMLNHIGSQHAGGLFSVAEAASGAAFAGAFAERLGEWLPLAQQAEITYERIAKGPITASAALQGDPTEIAAEVESEGRARFPITVVLSDESEHQVASARVDWYVRLREA